MRRQLYFDFNFKCWIRFCFSCIPLRLNWIYRMLFAFHFFSLLYRYNTSVYRWDIQYIYIFLTLSRFIKPGQMAQWDEGKSRTINFPESHIKKHIYIYNFLLLCERKGVKGRERDENLMEQYRTCSCTILPCQNKQTKINKFREEQLEICWNAHSERMGAREAERGAGEEITTGN